MISNFFVLSPRGDTIIAKQYRTRKDEGAHERSHTEAFFRKVKFWNDMAQSIDVDTSSTSGLGGEGPANGLKSENGSSNMKGDAPPVFVMPDGLSYLHVKRNGLIFGCSTARNVSPCTVIEVSLSFLCISHNYYLRATATITFFLFLSIKLKPHTS